MCMIHDIVFASVDDRIVSRVNFWLYQIFKLVEKTNPEPDKSKHNNSYDGGKTNYVMLILGTLTSVQQWQSVFLYPTPAKKINPVC